MLIDNTGATIGQKAERCQTGGGLAGARLRSCDQNALQEVALVKEPLVDDVWRASVSYAFVYDRATCGQ